MDLNITNEFARTDSRATTRHDAPLGEVLFTTAESALGIVLVARSSVGVCSILIGSEAATLTADLAERFPSSALTRNDRALARDLEKILRFIAAPERGLNLELDVHGTPFQRRVWDALCAIPSGRTVTYAALARRIGEPGSVRAVANACAANAIALAIPCHRVIRSDGTLSGYRWGVERKRAMLTREARSP
jgi:methylated-DNA-[protein]-cysteine S-methyltransferase/AraC family transcriptional regulator of adaptative response/methylated-DNA-[protein]-cysteine methyltransferase